MVVRNLHTIQMKPTIYQLVTYLQNIQCFKNGIMPLTVQRFWKAVASVSTLAACHWLTTYTPPSSCVPIICVGPPLNSKQDTDTDQAATRRYLPARHSSTHPAINEKVGERKDIKEPNGREKRETFKSCTPTLRHFVGFPLMGHWALYWFAKRNSQKLLLEWPN